jgi:UDP-3-O-[3-hydroxymyristoyl] glucosamine N-acyltransferase
MKITAAQLAQLLDGEVEGNPNAEISGLSKIEEGKPGTLTFLANPAYTHHVYTTEATLLIAARDFEPERHLPKGLTLLRVANPYESFARLLDLYNQIKHNRTGIDPMAFVHPEAQVHQNAYIGAFAVVEKGAVVAEGAMVYPQCFVGEGVHIGAHTLLHPGVRVLTGCVIGAHCVVNSGAVIGGDGFGFAPNSENNYKKVAQTGNVIIENHVEIGAGSTIDRATLGSTIIRRGAKLDNLIQIAHNVEIGENTVIASQTGVAGSTRIGKNCMIGGQVGIVGHLTIADGTKIAAQSGVGASIHEPDTVIQGSPAFGMGDYKRSYVAYRRLPDIMKELDALKKELASLKKTTEI